MYKMISLDFEITSQSNPACKDTRYKEAVECQNSGRVYRRFDIFLL